MWARSEYMESWQILSHIVSKLGEKIYKKNQEKYDRNVSVF